MTKTKLYTPSAPRFSRSWWLDVARNGFFVALITLLIWMYADFEVGDDKSFHTTVLLTTGRSAKIELLSPRETLLKFTLRGTRRGLRTFENFLDQKGGRIEYDISLDYQPGEHTVSPEKLINQNDLLNRMGLSVVSTVPSEIRFRLDERVEQTALVELDYTGAQLVGEPVIDPLEVLITLTRTDLENIKERLGQGRPITLKTEQIDLAAVAAGKPFVREASVLPPAGRFPITLGTKRVTVSLQVSQRTDQKTINVTVQTIAPSAWAEPDGVWQQYELVKKTPLAWRRQITVSGARKDVERLRAEDVEAYITLTEEDTKPVASWLSRTPVLRMPAGMDLQLIGDPFTVDFKLQKRLSPPAQLPPPAGPTEPLQ